MAPKRTHDEEDHHNNDDTHLQTVAKRRRDKIVDHPCCAVLEAVVRKCVEPVLRKLAQLEDVISRMQQTDVSPCRRFCHNHQGGSSGRRANYQLCFVNELPQVIFTMANLTAEDGGSLEIELRDAASQKRVDTEEFSSMEAQIYVLDGAFESQDWTAEEFDGNVVKPREGKGKLLKGKTVIKIEKGVGLIDKKCLQITDISSNTTNKTFRLGVKILGSNSLGAGIREAISEPFRVKDKRGESTKKSKRPALNDKVWRLRNIGKTGKLCEQLSENGIEDVKQLLRWNTTGLLRTKFSKTKTWDKIIEHAKECKLDPAERYLYTYRAMEPEKSVSLILNCIYELVEVIINGQPRSLRSLDSKEQHLVETIKKKAYSNNGTGLALIHPTTDIESMLRDTQTVSDSAPYQGLQLPDHLDDNWPLLNEVESCFPPGPNPNWVYALSNPCGDNGASSSKDNPSEYIASKGKAKMVSQKVESSQTPHTSAHGFKKEPIAFCRQN